MWSVPVSTIHLPAFLALLDPLTRELLKFRQRDNRTHFAIILTDRSFMPTTGSLRLSAVNMY